MDATAAMLIWTTLESLLFTYRDSGEYRERFYPEGCVCTLELDDDIVIELFECEVLDVTYLALNRGLEHVLVLATGKSADIYNADFILEARPEPAWLL